MTTGEKNRPGTVYDAEVYFLLGRLKYCGCHGQWAMYDGPQLWQACPLSYVQQHASLQHLTCTNVSMRHTRHPVFILINLSYINEQYFSFFSLEMRKKNWAKLAAISFMLRSCLAVLVFVFCAKNNRNKFCVWSLIKSVGLRSTTQRDYRGFTRDKQWKDMRAGVKVLVRKPPGQAYSLIAQQHHNIGILSGAMAL